MSPESLPAPLGCLAEKDRTTRKLQHGEVLFCQENATAGLFFLVSGMVDLYRTSSSGHNILIHRAQPGDTFAEASLFSDFYHCTANAARDSVIVECRRSAISTLLNTDIEFTRKMAARFAAQIQTCRRRVELLSIRAADERILAAIKDDLLVDNIAKFADIIGLAPETVYRTLNRLAKKGQICKTARGLYRLDSNNTGPPNA